MAGDNGQQQQQLLRLAGRGMRLDELGRVRVMDEDAETHAGALRDVCDQFVRDTAQFQAIADSFIDIFDAISGAVEREKIKAIGARNMLKG